MKGNLVMSSAYQKATANLLLVLVIIGHIRDHINNSVSSFIFEENWIVFLLKL